MNFVSILLVFLSYIGSSASSNNAVKENKVTFRIKKGFGNIDGQFSKIDYRVSLDNAGSGTIYGSADISSVSSGNATRDKHLQNKEWFDAANHPRIIVQSNKIVRQREGKYLGTFEIKIKGKTEVKEIPFQVITGQNSKVLTANFALSTGTFDIGGGIVDLIVGDKVTVSLKLHF